MSDLIKIEVKDAAIRKALKKLAEKTSNLRPVMRAIAEKMMDATKENFRTEGSRLGKKWADLSPATKKQRAEKGYNGRMLQVQRKLYNSVSAYSDNDSAVVGTNLVYAKVHQLGFDDSVNVHAHSRKVASRNVYRKNKRGEDTKTLESSGIGFVKTHSRKMHMPARPFLGLNDKDLTGIAGTIKSYLTTD